MIALKPFSIQYTFVCPDCNCKFGQPEELIFQGTHVLANCLCECCEQPYYHTLPTGHAALFPVALSQKTAKASYDRKWASWLALPLIASLKEGKSVQKVISKKILNSHKNVVLLNCLDSCYGHVFLKLLNAQHCLRNHPDRGLIVLIPANFSWMLPQGLAEVWQVEAPLKEFNRGIANLDAFVKEELKRFDSVLLSEVPVHPDISSFELKDFLKIEKFELQQFSARPPQITFVLREDRFWLNTKPDAWLWKLAVSKGWMGLFRNYFIRKQNRLINALAKDIHTRLEGKISFYATGLGKTGVLDSLIQDRRQIKTEEKIEKEWCKFYAESHLVIGVHGSNMLVPTALSAGFIELLPRHKIYNLTEDIAMVHKGRYMHFLGRFLDEFSSVKLVATHAVSMLEWFPVVKKNMEQNNKNV